VGLRCGRGDQAVLGGLVLVDFVDRQPDDAGWAAQLFVIKLALYDTFMTKTGGWSAGRRPPDDRRQAAAGWG
jgi:hypothetical protein